MGSEQSSPVGPVRERGVEALPTSPSAVAPTTAASSSSSSSKQLRDGGAVSPRQGSVCSDSDVPYVSYTVNKPIGDSPKRKPSTPAASSRSSRFSSPRLSSRVPRLEKDGSSSSRLARSAHNTLLTVNHLRLAEDLRSDEELVRLQEIPTFFPVMQAGQAETGKGLHQSDILSRLDPAPLNHILQRYEEYLRNAATRVAADQGVINRRIREVEGEVSSLTTSLQDRQRKYERSCEKLAGAREISRTLAKCHMLLNENIDMMEALNSALPRDLRLEPFVWTTG